jgi:two-component system OmpR family sensor kinase
MDSTLRRGLFWRVYLTLVASLVLAALLAGGLMHLFGQQGSRIVVSPRRHAGGPHMLAMLTAIAALVGLAAYPVVARITRRLERLRLSMDEWGGGRLTTRAAVEGRDEVAAVAASFNAAADQVEALLAAHKDLLAHASHELRSPLARLRMAVEMYAASSDPALRPSIVGDIAELTAIVDEILLASRLDQVPDLESHERVDCLGLAAEEAARADATLRQAEPAEAVFEVEGSPRLLRRMLRNLIENASRHGAPPVEIGLSRQAHGQVVQVIVDDEGPGIPELERERVFEPFYRPRGRPEAAGSWGLGLSIVRQIAGRHGGTATCETRPGGGGRFVVSLPAAPSAPSEG